MWMKKTFETPQMKVRTGHCLNCLIYKSDVLQVQTAVNCLKLEHIDTLELLRNFEIIDVGDRK